VDGFVANVLLELTRRQVLAHRPAEDQEPLHGAFGKPDWNRGGL
jgi:hypothetical protein